MKGTYRTKEHGKKRAMLPVKEVLLLTAVMLLLAGCATDQGTRRADGRSGAEDPWNRVDEILARIVPPQFPDRDYRLTDFGGSGDGVTDNREAFERAIMACHEEGGGRVVVGPGSYLVNGPIHLRDTVNLHLEEGARVLFGSEPEDYLPHVLTSWEGTRCYNYSPFIYAYRLSNVAITGKGEIDGESSGTWAAWQKKQDDDKALLRRMNNMDVPVDQRIFGEGHFLRPHLVQFYGCEKILVEGVKITDAPFWCLHFVFSRNITVRDVRYEAFNYNNDGIDPESSEDILIEDITFNNRDDNIAIKAGRDLEARTLGRPSRNIVVRNCLFKGHNAIAVGSEMSGGVYNVFVENCGYAGKVEYGFYLKGNRDRGGVVHDIYARNLEFDTTRSAIIIDSNYKNEGSCCVPVFGNVLVEDLTAGHAIDHGIYIKGYESAPVDSVTLRDVRIRSAGTPVELEHVSELTLEDVRINRDDFSSGEPVTVEWIRGASPETGRQVWQVTSGTGPSVACYFEGQAFTGDEKYIVFSSSRSGEWALYRTDLSTGRVNRITPEGRKIAGDDYTVMPDGKRVCYLDGWVLYATDVEKRTEEVLFDYTGQLPAPPRFTGSFTGDGRYTMVFVTLDTLAAIYRTDLRTGKVLEVHRRTEGRVSHPLLNPEDPDVITYVPGPDTQNDMTLPMEARARTWKVDLEAGTDRQFLTAPYGFRATHESWSHDGERFFFFRKSRPDWVPVAICSIDREGGDWQVHYVSDTIYLGHGTSSRDGRWFISDSQEPGRNELVLVDLESGRGEVLCYPDASTDGGHAEHAHVHPSFSPKGNYVCYTSDRTGVPQVYVVPLGGLTGNPTRNPAGD